MQIPVSLVPAESRSEELHFRQLDRHDLSPVRYERVNASTGKPIAWKDTVDLLALLKQSVTNSGAANDSRAHPEKARPRGAAKTATKKRSAA